jgi:L-asparaginase II
MEKHNVLVHVNRGELTESVHNGHIAVVNDKGILSRYIGNPSLTTFARSAAKPLQAMAVLESGAAKQFNLSRSEISVIGASHNGEPRHIDAVTSIFKKIGCNPELLQCGPHYPFHKPTALKMTENNEKPTSLHNNCSGKHAGMLALAKYLKAPLDQYMDVDHPVQQQMLETISEMTDIAGERIHLAIDGCGVPVFGIPIDRLAYAFARLGTGRGLSQPRSDAAQAIIGALREEPFYLAGSDRFDSKLIEATHGKIIGKMGAEGVYALSVPELAIGIAVKIEDGAMRALYPAVVEALRQLHFITADQMKQLQPYYQPDVLNWRGTKVGQIIPQFQLIHS